MGEWEKLIQPLCNKVTVAERFGKEVVFNLDGARTLRNLLTKMAAALDERIAQDERQAKR